VIDIIKEIARDVFRELGSGHSETIYQNAIEVGLRIRGMKFEAQRVIPLAYKDHFIGYEELDLLVEMDSVKVIVELKVATGEIQASDERQLQNYMNGLSISHGLLIRFPKPGVDPADPDVEFKVLPEKIVVDGIVAVSTG